MHIAIVCRGLGQPGGVASVALRQARELARHATVNLISDSLPVDAPGVVARVRDLRFLRRFRHVPDEWLFTRAARKALFDLHRRNPVDFVLCHSHAAAYLAARGFRRGLFVHGDISDRPAGTYDRRLTAFYRWVTPRAYRSANVVFALARPFAEIAQRAGASHVEIIPNGIDPADIGLPLTLALSPLAGRGDGEPLRILYVGRLSIEKGLPHLIAAIPGNCTLDLVGAGPLESEIRNEIAARGLESRVRLLGTRPRSELGAIYRQHHVFCTPALSEPFASVITEALASGIPVIGTTVGGIPEVIEHETNGLLVPPADSGALAAALTRLEHDEPFRRALAANARHSVLPRLSWSGIGDRLAAVIRTMQR